MTYLLGVDVSKYQTVNDWSSGGIAFFIARASIGTTKDSQYDAHIAKARAAGLVTGAYHFNWDADNDPAASTPEQQADFFVQTAGDVDLLFLDVEGAKAFEPGESQRFIKRVQSKGLRIGLYMSLSPFRDDGQDYNWIAYWSSTPPTKHWEFWQYGAGQTSPDGGKIDGDRFYGTLEQLKALSNKETIVVKPVTNQKPANISWNANTPYYALDGVTKVGTTGSATSARYSPFACGSQRAFYYGPADKVQVALITPTAITPLPDDTPYSQAQLDAAKQASYNTGYTTARGKATVAVQSI